MRRILFIVSILFIFKINYSQKKYFQQKVNTSIEVSLNDNKHELNAFEKIEYINNSNTKLDSIVIHLWPNAYKNINTSLAKHDLENGETDFRFSDINNKGFIDSLDFSAENEKLKWSYFNKHIDIAVIELNKSLLPGDTIIISTPFRVKIPLGIYSRLGHIGQSYQITQWFPKPAVFDKNGWHPIPYLSQGEFYSEFGSYDIKITLPENYVIGATGDLINGEKELEFLNEKIEKTQQLIASKEYFSDLSFPSSSSKTKTLHFHQENVHDFAWFADKRYHVLKGEIELPNSKRKVDTWAMFTNNEFDLWKDAISHINDATYNYSLWVGEYPYNHVTAVDGSISAGGGMEYPNITVIGESGNNYFHDEVITHEVGHNWFYGILGNNERENAWMDEGINSFVEYRHMHKKYPKVEGTSNKLLETFQLNGQSLMQLGYKFNATRNNDQPIQMGANLYTPMNYGLIVYGKTGIGFNYLKEYLGEPLFDTCMHTYYNKWKFKHPSPEDIQTVFETSSSKNLDWFFETFIKTTKKIDYKIQNVKRKGDNSFEVKLKNITGFNAPITLTAINKSDSSITYNKWITGFKNDTTFYIETNGETDKIILDQLNVSTDINSENNFSKTGGILKKTAPLKLKLLAGIESNQFTNIYFTPIIGWNNYDSFMIGASFYNSIILEKKLEWAASPMFSFGNKTLVGSANINYQFYPENVFSKISFGHKLASYFHEPVFSNKRWMKNELYSSFKIKPKSLRSSAVHNFKIRGIRIDEHIFSGNFTEPPSSQLNKSHYGVLEYSVKNKQFLTPKNLSIQYIYGISASKSLVSSISLTGNYRINYNKRLDGVEFRLFTGYNFFSSSPRYNFLMKGQDGYYDYLFERTYLGRNVGYPNMLVQQSSNTHGAFNINTSIGRPEEWIISTNIKIEIPKIPLGLFSDIGAFPNIENFQNPSTGAWEESKTITPMLNAGIYFSVKTNKKEVLSIYFPILHSQNINNSSIYTGSPITTIKNINFLQKITFVLSLENISPRNLINSFGQ